MVEETEQNRTTRNTGERVILSEGAGIALTSVFSRLVNQKQEREQPTERKRPRAERAHVVLTKSEEVQEKLIKQREEKKRYREAKKAKLQFESNGRIIPDAATGAAHEKQLHTIALQGAVALFNAVTKAQKAADNNQTKKKGAPVTKEKFMNMMKAGISGNPMLPTEKPKDDGSDSDDEYKSKVVSGAKWLKDDFLTGESAKLKDWERPNSRAADVENADDGEEGDEEDEAGSDDMEEISDADSEIAESDDDE